MFTAPCPYARQRETVIEVLLCAHDHENRLQRPRYVWSCVPDLRTGSFLHRTEKKRWYVRQERVYIMKTDSGDQHVCALCFRSCVPAVRVVWRSRCCICSVCGKLPWLGRIFMNGLSQEQHIMGKLNDLWQYIKQFQLKTLSPPGISAN